MKRAMSLVFATMLATVLVVSCARPSPKPDIIATSTPVSKTTAASTAAPIVLKLVSFTDVAAPSSISVKKLSELVDKRSNGRLIIKHIGGPEAIPPADQPSAAQSGVVDITYTHDSAMAPLVPAMRGAALSELMPWEERENGFYDLLLDASKKANMYYLGRASQYKPNYLLTTFPVQKPEDLKKVIFATGAAQLPWIKEVGSSGVVMAPGEWYTAIERRLANGVPSVLSSILSYKLYEVAHYLVEVASRPATNTFFVMGLNKFNSLPKDLQELLTKAAADYERESEPYWRDELLSDRSKVIANGVQFVQWSPEDAKWLSNTINTVSWQAALQASPDYGPKLMAAGRKK